MSDRPEGMGFLPIKEIRFLDKDGKEVELYRRDTRETVTAEDVGWLQQVIYQSADGDSLSRIDMERAHSIITRLAQKANVKTAV